MAEQTQEVEVPTNDRDSELIRSIFTNNEALLKSIRALFFGLGISDEEKALIKSTFENKALVALFWKRFSPKLDRDMEIGKISDGWLGVEKMIYGQHENTIQQSIRYKADAIDMVEKALRLLEDPDGEAIDLSYHANKYLEDPLGINLLARNQYMQHIEKQLLYIWVIAEVKNKTPEEIQARINANSNK